MIENRWTRKVKSQSEKIERLEAELSAMTLLAEGRTKQLAAAEEEIGRWERECKRIERGYNHLRSGQALQNIIAERDNLLEQLAVAEKARDSAFSFRDAAIKAQAAAEAREKGLRERLLEIDKLEWAEHGVAGSDYEKLKQILTGGTK